MGKPNGFVIAFLATIDHRLWVFNLAVQRHPLMTLQAPMFAIRSVGLFVALICSSTFAASCVKALLSNWDSFCAMSSVH